MKKLIYLLLLSTSLPLLAQDYLPFIQPDNRWQVSINATATVWDFDRMYEDFFGEEIEWQGTNYTQVLRHEFERSDAPGGLEQYPQPFVAGEDVVIGLVREDLAEKKAYFRWADFNNPGQYLAEFLLYDFSLEIGDTFYDELVDAGPYMVSQIGLDQVTDSQERRLWVLDNGMTIIEGVGSQFGPFEGVTAFISGAYPSLYRFCQGAAGTCNVLSSTDRFRPAEVQVFYPNPAQEELRINQLLPGHEVVFINALGEHLARYKLNREALDISQLPSGVLLYQLIDDKANLIGIGRVIKN